MIRDKVLAGLEMSAKIFPDLFAFLRETARHDDMIPRGNCTEAVP
jgi:hypothetical protein